MQPTLNTITTAIASHLQKELDEPFKRLLSTKVDAWRSTLIGRSLEKTPQQRRLFTQTIYVDMQEVSAAPVGPCIEYIARSTNTIPRPMRIGNVLFDYAGSIDGQSTFGTSVNGTQQYLMANKYAKNLLYAEYVNFKLVIRGNSRLPKVMVTAVFDNPTEVFEFSGGTDFWNEPYPATNDMIQMITQYILQVDYQRPVLPAVEEVEVTDNTTNNGERRGN